MEDRRRAAAAALLDAIRFSEEAGAEILVAHFGTDQQAQKTVTELLDQTKDLRIRLMVETMGIFQALFLFLNASSARYVGSASTT